MAGSFSEVAGQRAEVDRPPAGYVTIIDHDGHAGVVAVEVLTDAPVLALREIRGYRRRPWRVDQLALPTELPDGPARPRRGDPATSRAAASSIGDLPARHRAILDLIRHSAAGLTDESLVELYGWRYARMGAPRQTPQSIRSRRCELARAGWVRDAERSAVTASGRQATVWEATL